MNGHHRWAKRFLLGVLVVVGVGTLLWVGLAGTKLGGEYTAKGNISRILIVSRPEGGGMARREFRPDGWVSGGHASGDPMRVYEEREKIPKREVKAIWAAASVLQSEVPGEVSTPQPEWGGTMELTIISEDGSAMRFLWPLKGQHPHPSVQALAQLLLAHDVGGW
jgi:hypothetical protein